MNKYIFFLIFCFSFFAFINIVNASCGGGGVCDGASTKDTCDALKSSGCDWKTTASGGTVPIDNPLGNATPESIIGKVINAVLGISGSLALLMFVYGGFTWMLSGGSPEKVTKGKNTLVWATIGLVVIFSSYALVNFVFEGLKSTAS